MNTPQVYGMGREEGGGFGMGNTNFLLFCNYNPQHSKCYRLHQPPFQSKDNTAHIPCQPAMDLYDEYDKLTSVGLKH